MVPILFFVLFSQNSYFEPVWGKPDRELRIVALFQAEFTGKLATY